MFHCLLSRKRNKNNSGTYVRTRSRSPTDPPPYSPPFLSSRANWKRWIGLPKPSLPFSSTYRLSPYRKRGWPHSGQAFDAPRPVATLCARLAQPRRGAGQNALFREEISVHVSPLGTRCSLRCKRHPKRGRRRQESCATKKVHRPARAYRRLLRNLYV